MMKEKQEFLDQTQREADDILEAARFRAERMVQRTEIVREAGHTARRLIEDARDESRGLRLEAEDYCDQKLAEFEIVLDRTIKTVACRALEAVGQSAPAEPAARHRVAPGLRSPGGAVEIELGDDILAGEDVLFDQDQRA